jgi:hypothetical protein
LPRDRWQPRQLLWLLAGGASGAAVYLGDPAGLLLAIILLVLAVVTTFRAGLVLPAYLSGVGLVGLILTLAMSATGVFTIQQQGRSPVCSSAGGCQGAVVSHAGFEVPALLVFAILVLIGGAWLLWQQPTRRHDATA